jgi:hypothetical protein
MGLRRNPVTYLILYNGLLWGLPLAIIQIKTLVADRDVRPLEMAQVRPTTQANQLVALDRISELDPLNPNVVAMPPAAMPPGGLDRPSIIPPVLQAQPRAVDVAEIPRTQPDLLTQLKGADGLGGPITLDARNSPLVPIAARAERLQWERSNDSLAALPLHWRDSLRQELGKGGARVSQAATVRLPVRELAERQEVPLIINDKGVAEALVEPRHERVREAVETWAARQQPAETGTVQVMVVAAEPLPAPQQ